jgi:flagellar protein FlaG
MEAAMINEVAGRDAIPAALARGDAVKSAEAQLSQRPAQATHTDATPESSSADRKVIEDTIAKIREFIGPANSSLKIEIDPDTDRIVVKILDDQSGELIRQIPSQEMVEIAKRLDAMQGIFVTKRT